MQQKIFYSLLLPKKKTRTETVTSENRFKEQDPDRIFDRNCLDYRNKLVQIYEEKANAVKIRSTWEWYEFGEKSSKFYLT